MPLENRVLPNGDLVAQAWRGDFMGNRGGKIHDPVTRRMTKRRWVSKRWIICRTVFRDRHRQVMGPGYTELFFLDDVSALAAGHRPCFECRRMEATEFAEHWARCFGAFGRSSANTIDAKLHGERTGTKPTITRQQAERLVPGSMVAAEGRFFARAGNGFLEWRDGHYQTADLPMGHFEILTPPSTIAVLESGYLPQWHRSIRDTKGNMIGTS